jgi:hypothetical protein
MLPCEKRQVIIRRNSGEVKLRCINRDCDAFGHNVDEEACKICPVRAYTTKPPCKQKREPCDDCQPIKDEVLAKALHQNSPIVEIKPEDTPDGKGVKDYPPMSLQLWTYKEALVRWQKAGRPTRTDEEVDQILKEHCTEKQCDWYDPEKKRCRGCGCRVTDSGYAIVNKVRMATEHCPKERW